MIYSILQYQYMCTFVYVDIDVYVCAIVCIYYIYNILKNNIIDLHCNIWRHKDVRTSIRVPTSQ